MISTKAMNGRCIDSEISDPPFVMALDDFFLDLASHTDDFQPVLHFYRKTPSISLGYFQRVENDVDRDKCRELGIGIYRRTSGGGTVYEDEDQIIYGLILPEPQKFNVPPDRRDSFRFLNQAVISALGDLGFQGDYVPVNDILINGRKVSGCAQTRRKGALLQHGTLILKHDPTLMFGILKVSPEKLGKKELAHAADRITSLEMESGTPVDIQHVKSRLKFHFSHLLGIDFQDSCLTEEERERAEELASRRYRSESWNFSR